MRGSFNGGDRNMTEAEWNSSDDAGAMLDYLWEQFSVSPESCSLRFGGDMRGIQPQDASAGLDRVLHRFCLASCRRMWKLLPQEDSRRGVQMGEQWLAGKVSGEEITKFKWYVEGAAFCIDYNTAPEDIARWVAEVRALPKAELRSMLHPPETADRVEPRELLKRAAYFAHYAMVYPKFRPKGPPPASYRPFLSAELLREFVRYPA